MQLLDGPPWHFVRRRFDLINFGDPQTYLLTISAAPLVTEGPVKYATEFNVLYVAAAPSLYQLKGSLEWKTEDLPIVSFSFTFPL